MKLIYLSDKFYEKYENCPEILEKSSRPYACLEIIIDGLTFAVPFRHHITHKYAFVTLPGQGLDYTKAVVIEAEEYISPLQPRIESKEYQLIKGREALIANGMKKYYRLYLKAAANSENPYYQNILRCSALQYFGSIQRLPHAD